MNPLVKAAIVALASVLALALLRSANIETQTAIFQLGLLSVLFVSVAIVGFALTVTLTATMLGKHKRLHRSKRRGR